LKKEMLHRFSPHHQQRAAGVLEFVATVADATASATAGEAMVFFMGGTHWG